MLKLNKIAFILLTILLALLSIFVGGYAGLRYSTTSIQSGKGWQQLSVTPARAVQLLESV